MGCRLYFVLLFFCWGNLSAETLRVFAREGLILRDKPAITGKRLAVIPFGIEVEITKVEEATPLSVNGISGSYVKVEYRGRSGFIFNGFLSRMPLPPANISSVEEYFEKVFGPGKKVLLKVNPEDSETRKEQISLLRGIEIFRTIYLGGAYTTIEMPADYEIREIFLLFVAIEDVFKTARFDENNPDYYECRVYPGDPKGKTGTEFLMSITREGNRLTILTGGQT